MSGRTRQASALCLVDADQFQDLGLKRILCAVNGSDCFRERFLLQLFLNGQTELSEFFDIGPGVKLQLSLERTTSDFSSCVGSIG